MWDRKILYTGGLYSTPRLSHDTPSPFRIPGNRYGDPMPGPAMLSKIAAALLG